MYYFRDMLLRKKKIFFLFSLSKSVLENIVKRSEFVHTRK